MSIVGTSRGLLAHRAGVGFSEQATVPHSSGAEKWVSPHSDPKAGLPGAVPLPGVVLASTWWAGGCTPGSPLHSQACPKRSVFLQSNWRGVV